MPIDMATILEDKNLFQAFFAEIMRTTKDQHWGSEQF